MAGGPSSSGKPCPRLIAPCSPASADITVNTVVGSFAKTGLKRGSGMTALCLPKARQSRFLDCGAVQYRHAGVALWPGNYRDGLVGCPTPGCHRAPVFPRSQSSGGKPALRDFDCLQKTGGAAHLLSKAPESGALGIPEFNCESERRALARKVPIG